MKGQEMLLEEGAGRSREVQEKASLRSFLFAVTLERW